MYKNTAKQYTSVLCWLKDTLSSYSALLYMFWDEYFYHLRQSSDIQNGLNQAGHPLIFVA